MTEEMLEGFAPLSLEELDERAALLKRGDGETDKRQTEHPVDETAFERITLAAREGSERLTCDIGVRLARPDGNAARLREDVILVETKSERGESPADRRLAELGLEPISLSKYRVGMSLAGGADGGPQPGSDLFVS